MRKTTKGYSRCPGCDALQPVMTDGFKYFIHCSECHTFTHYQVKSAKNRLEEKLLPDLTDELEVLPAEAEPAKEIAQTPAIKPAQEPAKPAEVIKPAPVQTPAEQPATPAKPLSLIERFARYL